MALGMKFRNRLALLGGLSIGGSGTVIKGVKTGSLAFVCGTVTAGQSKAVTAALAGLGTADILIGMGAAMPNASVLNGLTIAAAGTAQANVSAPDAGGGNIVVGTVTVNYLWIVK